MIPINYPKQIASTLGVEMENCESSIFKPDLMTVEKLRQHLFLQKKVPFWNYEESNLTIGLEVEYFIAQRTNQEIRLATRSEYILMTKILMEKFGYVDRGLTDQPGRVSKDTDIGYVTIKPDFAWHILEVSLPPRRSVSQLRDLIGQIFSEVDEALAAVNLERLDISCLPTPPRNMDLVSVPRLRGITNTFMVKSERRPTQDPFFPAYIASTHVHLNASSEESLKYLPILYNLDHLVSRKFTRANRFHGQVYDNARTKMYADTLGKEYLLHTYPTFPANNLQALVNQMNQSPRLFPMDPFFPVRDMSYIRPTRYGTLEFRSCCSFKSVDIITRIVECRIAQLLAATGVDRNRIYALLGEAPGELPA
jgi:hypothetical protein